MKHILIFRQIIGRGLQQRVGVGSPCDPRRHRIWVCSKVHPVHPRPILTPPARSLSHPIHLHGHDFWILAQDVGIYLPGLTKFNTTNPARRDVATLPGNGYLAIAFKLDNPGAWLVHCHIAWHASQGLALEFVESEGQISSASLTTPEKTVLTDTCDDWKSFTATSQYFGQDDSGI